MDYDGSKEQQAIDDVDIASSGMNTTHRHDIGLGVRLLQASIRPFSPQIAKPSAVKPAGSPRLKAPWPIRRQLTVTEREIEGVWTYDLVSKTQYSSEKTIGSIVEEPLSHREEHSPSSAPRKRIRNRLVYFSGGCWQMIPTRRHWSICASLALSLPNTTVTIVSYPLAPNSPAPSTFPQLSRLYPHFFAMHEPDQAPERVTFLGDSAGGNIAMALTLDALTRAPDTAPAPASLLLICPSVDLTRANPAIWHTQDRDPLLTAKFVVETAANWAGDWSREDPRLSPLFADVRLLARRGVRVNGIVGGVDLLGEDAKLFRDKCARAGVKGEWLDWDGLMHCWILFPGWLIRESRTALKWTEQVLRAEMDLTSKTDEKLVAQTAVAK
jgi:acetyl esterase/lipase